MEGNIINNENINIHYDNEQLLVKLANNEEYIETKFNEAINVLETIIVNIKEEYKYHLVIDLTSQQLNFVLPLNAYMKIVGMLNNINKNLTKSCNSIIIFCKDSGTWSQIYSFVNKLWFDKDRRPILFTDNKAEADNFMKTNKIF